MWNQVLSGVIKGEKDTQRKEMNESIPHPRKEGRKEILGVCTHSFAYFSYFFPLFLSFFLSFLPSLQSFLHHSSLSSLTPPNTFLVKMERERWRERERMETGKCWRQTYFFSSDFFSFLSLHIFLNAHPFPLSPHLPHLILIFDCQWRITCIHWSESLSQIFKCTWLLHPLFLIFFLLFLSSLSFFSLSLKFCVLRLTRELSESVCTTTSVRKGHRHRGGKCDLFFANIFQDQHSSSVCIVKYYYYCSC